MTTTPPTRTRAAPAPPFSAWSPVVAGLAAFSTSVLQAWMVAAAWVLVVVCALPFKRFRLVVPLAIGTWAVGTLCYYAIMFTVMMSLGLVLSQLDSVTSVPPSR